MFTTQAGALVNRQAVVNDIGRAARKAKLDPVGIATHTGRRTVITALYANGNLDLGDVARHVGHSDTKTTAGYVRDLGQRPADTAKAAARTVGPNVRARVRTRRQRPGRPEVEYSSGPGSTLRSVSSRWFGGP